MRNLTHKWIYLGNFFQNQGIFLKILKKSRVDRPPFPRLVTRLKVYNRDQLTSSVNEESNLQVSFFLFWLFGSKVLAEFNELGKAKADGKTKTAKKISKEKKMQCKF